LVNATAMLEPSLRAVDGVLPEDQVRSPTGSAAFATWTLSKLVMAPEEGQLRLEPRAATEIT
jgi:hypothetical protein